MSATLASGDQGARHLLLERPERDGDGRLPATSSAALDSNFGVWVVRYAVGGAGGDAWVYGSVEGVGDLKGGIYSLSFFFPAARTADGPGGRGHQGLTPEVPFSEEC